MPATMMQHAPRSRVVKNSGERGEEEGGQEGGGRGGCTR